MCIFMPSWTCCDVSSVYVCMYVCAHVVQIFVCFYPYGEASFCLCINKRCYLQSFDSAAVYIYNVCACVYTYICVCVTNLYTYLYIHMCTPFFTICAMHALISARTTVVLQAACMQPCGGGFTPAGAVHDASVSKGPEPLLTKVLISAFLVRRLQQLRHPSQFRIQQYGFCDEWQPQSPNPKQLAPREFEAD